MAKLTKEQLQIIQDFKAKSALLKQIQKLEKDRTVLESKIEKIDIKLAELVEQIKQPNQKQMYELAITSIFLISARLNHSFKGGCSAHYNPPLSQVQGEFPCVFSKTVL